jgi:hypothetical protein
MKTRAPKSEFSAIFWWSKIQCSTHHEEINHKIMLVQLKNTLSKLLS